MFISKKKAQPIFTDRTDSKNKSNTIAEIVKRSSPDSDWPQVLIFPEGTTTNGSSLISFKPGLKHLDIDIYIYIKALILKALHI